MICTRPMAPFHDRARYFSPLSTYITAHIQCSGSVNRRDASLAKTAKGRRGSLLAGCVGGDIRLAKSDGLSLRQSQGSFSHGRRGAPDFGVIIGCPESVSDLCPNPDVLATSRNSYDELRILQRGRHCTCNQLSGVAGSAAAICLLLRIQSENRRIIAAQ